MKGTNLTHIQKKYPGKWVALNENLDTVVAFGKDAMTAYQKAIIKGDKKPTLFKVPQKIAPYVG